MVKAGKIISRLDRKVRKNTEGSVSTTSSMSIGTSDGEVLIPTVVDGKRLTKEQAIAQYRKTGQHLGIFKTPDEADAYAEALHNEQARRMGLGRGRVPECLVTSPDGK